MMVPMTVMFFSRRKALLLRLHHWFLECSHVAMSDEQGRTNVKDNNYESNVLFIWRKKRMRGNE